MASKYHNEKVTINGEVFDSKKEARRYQFLLLLQKAGQINNLKRQVKYVLVPVQYIGGKCVERAVTYTSDFEYDKPTGEHIVEDCKGYRTDVYKLKKKLMLHKFGIRILET